MNLMFAVDSEQQQDPPVTAAGTVQNPRLCRKKMDW